MKSYAHASVIPEMGIHPAAEKIMIVAFAAMFIVYVIFMFLLLNQFFLASDFAVAPLPPMAIPTTIILPPP